VRDPIRQKELLDLIEAIWTKYPDLRLGQLLSNRMILLEGTDLFYLEDNELYKKLCEVYPL